MKKIILNALLVAFVFGGGVALADSNTSTAVGGKACTEEAMICPDGSSVGRTGPNCEFAKCPGSVSSSTPSKPGDGLIQRIRNVLGNNGDENKNQQRVANSVGNVTERHYEKIADKYLRTIQREEAIMAKIVSRIEKIKLAVGLTAQVGSITEAEKLVADAKASLTQARTAYETLKTTATGADNSTATTTKATLTGLKNSARLVENYMKMAHKSLQKTVGVLRGVSLLHQNATSTASSTEED